MGRITVLPKKIHDASVADGVGTSINVNGFKDKEIAITTTGNGAMVYKVVGSYDDSEPDFESASAPDNQWEYLQIKDLNSGSTVAGDTGVTQAGVDADNSRIFNVENNNIKWINIIVSTWTAGALTAEVKCAND